MRLPSMLALLLLALGIAGCGDGGQPALRIDLETFSFDGALPSGLRIRQVTPDRTGGEVYDLRRVAGGRRGEYESPVAPDGAYTVEGPAGWWMLQYAGASPPALVRGLQPPLVTLGRSRSLYVTAQAAEVRPSDVWGAVRIRADGVEEPVPITVEAGDRGYGVAVRFEESDWRGTLQVMGRVAVGPPPTPSPAADAPLAKPIRFEAAPDGRPAVERLRSSATGPLHVVLVAASAAVDPGGLRVRASYEGLPIASEFEAYGRGGQARFPGIPIVDRVLRLRAGDASGVHQVAPELRRRQANLRLLVTGTLPLRPIRVLPGAGGGEDLDVDLVLVRPAGAVAYGRVPFERVEGGIAFAAPEGALSLILRSGTRWASADEEGEGELELVLPETDFSEGVVVGGRVNGAPSEVVVRFFREVGTAGEAVLGDGFEVRVEPGGAFEAHLPTGRYLVEVAGMAGVWRRPAPMVALSPGARLHLPLERP